MKNVHFETETDGFCGVYWKCKNKSDAAMILLLGDDPEDFMAKSTWLKKNGIRKIGIAGASTTGTLALTAASYFHDITLTIGMTPSDFIWQGFMQGKKDGCREWPVEGEALFSRGCS